MKLLKLFGLVALAALMAMAFVGAGSAMATGSSALCEDMPSVVHDGVDVTGGKEDTVRDVTDGKDSDTDKADLADVADGKDKGAGVEDGKDFDTVADGTCASDDLVTHVHKTTLSGAKGKLLSSFNVECDVLFLGDVLGLATPQVIHSGAFTYTNCTSGCEVKQEGTALISVLRTSHETATVTGEGQVHVECGEFIDCKYNGTGLEGTGKGPLLSTHLNGETTITEKTTNRVGGLFCPSTAKLDITFTPLTHTYLGL